MKTNNLYVSAPWQHTISKRGYSSENESSSNLKRPSGITRPPRGSHLQISHPFSSSCC